MYCNVEAHRVSENLSQYLAGGAKAPCWSGKESNRQTLPILSENMSRTFKKVDSDRVLDLTVRLGDCLPPDHLARFVVDSVAQLDLSALYANSGTRGGEPYAPEVLLGLLLYGYATGVWSIA